jgi:phosphatidylinositol glycan class V
MSLLSPQWPRVLQSAPVAYLATAACWRWAAADWRRAFTLGLLPPAAAPAGAALPGRRSPSPSSAAARRAAAFRGAALAPYVYHLALMTAVALLVMHVNVATRFLSASPALYWFAALYLTEGGEAGEAGGAGGAGGARWRAAWVWGWALGFTALGCVLFPNFLPWT